MKKTKTALFLSRVSLTVVLFVFGCQIPHLARANTTLDKAKKLNFIVIFTDDQGYQDVGTYGGKHIYTPNIDKMAEEGMMLKDFYVASPLCSPSRAALMTGSYPIRIDMAVGSDFPVLLAGDKKGLNPDEFTIAEVMQSAGYKTAMFGKWHLGDQPEFLPTNQGFDEFFGLPYSHDIAPTHKRQGHFNFPDLPLVEQDTVIELNPEPASLTHRFTSRAIDFIHRHQNQPFFIYLPQPMPHNPLHVSRKFLKSVNDELKQKLQITDADIKAKNRKAMYPLVIAELDESVGQILNTLKALNLDENTVVIFTSDNGPAGLRNSDGSKRILSGRKGLTLEGGMREPAIIWGPGHIPKNTVSTELMTTMDLLPTFAKLSGVSLPDNRVIDGKNIWPILSGQLGAKSPHNAFYYFERNTLMAVRSGDFKLSFKGKQTGLFNLVTDPGEKHDLSTEFPERVALLTKLAANWLAQFDINEFGVCRHCRAAGYVKQPQYLTLPK